MCFWALPTGGTARGLDALAQGLLGKKTVGIPNKLAAIWAVSFFPSSTLSQGGKPPSCRLPQGWNMRARQDDTGP